MAYDNSGEIILEEGETYSIVLDRKSKTNMNRFQVSFTADGKSSLCILNPVLYSSLKAGSPNTEGITVISTQNQTPLNNVVNERQYSTRSFNVSNGFEISFVSDRKMLLKAIDLCTPGYDYTIGSWEIGLYCSNDGEHWTRIAENSTVNEVITNSSVYGSGRFFLRIHFNDDNNTGYLYNKLRVEKVSTYNDYRFYNLWLSEAYWVEDEN